MPNEELIMTNDEMIKLKEGDIVVNKETGNQYIVIYNDLGEHFVAVRSITVTNPSEWDKVERKEGHKKKVWINIYEDENADNGICSMTYVHPSKESADLNSAKAQKRLACIECEIEMK